jgi:hypothetical protein
MFMAKRQLSPNHVPPSARTPMPFRTSEVARAIRAAQNMGVVIDKIEIHPRDGTILIHQLQPKPAAAAA